MHWAKPLRCLLRSAALVACATFYSGAPGAAEIRPNCPHPGSPVFYFPVGALDVDRPDLDEMVRDWYSKHLRSMEEPSLTCGDAAASATYRFLWLRTFHHPIAVRIEFSPKEARLSAIELSGAGGYEPGTVLRRARRTLSDKEASQLHATLKQAAFWSLPKNDSRSGLDGSQWIIEGRRGTQHHLVERWMPQDGATKEIGLLFLKLTGFRISGPSLY